MANIDYAAFSQAARRHFDDASLLHEAERFANADHFAGLAAECGLKAILMEHLGGTLFKGKPTHPTATKSTKYSHLPDLWSDLATTAHGRAAAVFTDLISGPNPFTAWDVTERYSDGEHINQSRAASHLQNAARIITIYERAMIDGVLP